MWTTQLCVKTAEYIHNRNLHLQAIFKLNYLTAVPFIIDAWHSDSLSSVALLLVIVHLSNGISTSREFSDVYKVKGLKPFVICSVAVGIDQEVQDC